MQPHGRIKQHGFTIVELLIALTIMAMLITAVAFAFDAATKNYHANQGLYKTTNTARQALLRITNDIRTAYDAGDIPTNDPDESRLTLYENDSYDVRGIYNYDSAEQALYLDIVGDGKDPFLLCKNVTEMTFKRTASLSDPDKIRSVRISITLTDDLGEVSQTLAAASVIRKNL
jgi:prepilin-type N-terminal cleavage/methylation domain-containing protein